MNDLIVRKSYMNQLDKLKDKHIIKVVTGLRRAGKSTLLDMFAEQIHLSGINPKRIQQYNFEKPIFSENYSWRKIYQNILNKTDKNQQNYIFLDEPQQISEFERLIDVLFVEKHIDLYVNGV